MHIWIHAYISIKDWFCFTKTYKYHEEILLNSISYNVNEKIEDILNQGYNFIEKYLPYNEISIPIIYNDNKYDDILMIIY